MKLASLAAFALALNAPIWWGDHCPPHGDDDDDATSDDDSGYPDDDTGDDDATGDDDVSDDDVADDKCFRTGCSGEVCARHDVVTPCVFEPWFICLDRTVCEEQPSGKCDFTCTPEFDACLRHFGEPSCRHGSRPPRPPPHCDPHRPPPPHPM